jgi:hypothetical protein
MQHHAYFHRRRAELSVLAFGITMAFARVSAEEAGLRFAGVPITPGMTVRANVPLSAQEKLFAGEGGNPVPSYAVAVMAVPRNFDARKSWPVLVVFSTSDFHRQNRDDLGDFYRTAALSEGWLVLAGDGPQPARLDIAAWRAAMTMAALDALHRSFPHSNTWPVACAGFSGGAKRAGFIAPLLSRNGRQIVGIYLSGTGEDHLSEGYRKFQPGTDFLNTPVFVSSGHDDKIAPLNQQYDLKVSIERTGFRRVRLESFFGGHSVKYAHVSEALRWFRGLQNAR